MSRAAVAAVWVASALAAIGLVALAAWTIIPMLPQQAQTALIGTLTTTPGTVDELFTATGIGGYSDGQERVSHADVDREYVIAAEIWPWTLPPDWGFPRTRGVGDTPGHHYNGMGVRAAFALWAKASLDAVEAGRLDPDAATHLLDEVEAATLTLLDVRVLTDKGFIAESVTPLRSPAP